MKPALTITPALVSGTLRASASFQDPDLRLGEDRDRPPTIHLEEGGCDGFVVQGRGGGLLHCQLFGQCNDAFKSRPEFSQTFNIDRCQANGCNPPGSYPWAR